MSLGRAPGRLAAPPYAAAARPRPLDVRTPVVARRLRSRDYLLRRALAAADLIGVIVASTLALDASSGASGWPDLLLLAPTFVAWIVLFRVYGLYERDVKRLTLSLLDDLPNLFHAFLLGTVLLWAYLHLFDAPRLSVTGAIVMVSAGLASVSICRLLARRAFLRLMGPARVALVGRSVLSPSLVRKMIAHPEYGLEPIGEITLGDEPPGTLPHLGAIGDLDLAKLAIERRVDRVIVASPELPDELMMELVGACGAASVKVSILPRHVDALGPSLEVDDIEGLTMLGLNPLVLPRTSRALKRALDVAGAGAGLLLLSPLLAAAAVAIKLDTPGSILFRQRRIGRGGEPFTVLKFRTMVSGADRQVEKLRELSLDPHWLKLDRDPRVTRAGRWLRLTSLDELPQLWNVLRGEMSLVGPRPLSTRDDEQVKGWARARLDLAPGVTGMWQVLGRTDIPFDEMLKLDCVYVTNWSLWLDIKLIARTLPALFSRRGAN